MLYHLFYPLAVDIRLFNVFKYLTFRTIYAMITALLVAFVIGPWVIRKLESLQARQVIRTDGPESHLKKQGTPTMGGVLILAAALRPGDSGAALIDPSGAVVGVAFAIAPDKPGVAYALDRIELEAVLSGDLSTPVATGPCLR